MTAMNRSIRRAVVVGSGTMGGGIAAHFANAGIPVYMLDVTEEIAAASLKRLQNSKPPAFFTPDVAGLVTAGSLAAHEEWIGEGDWIIEAIVEELAPKRALVATIDRLRKPGSIVSSNTSGLPIAQIAAEASDDFKKHFVGTHFFNPPRYMKLLEVIPTPSTDPGVVDFVRVFGEQRLGKGVVLCKDTPNFIANRIASISGAMLLDFALEHGYTVEETDVIAGPLIGRPKTAAFRLQDLVGLDVASAVGANLYGLIENDESREVLRSPRVAAVRNAQMERGRLGDKTGQGFYKKNGKSILSLDFETGEYRERREPDIPSIAAASKIANLPERLAFVLAQDDKAGALARHVIYNTLAYASRCIPEITDDFANVDRAMRWGFSHEMGPFELWDALGVRETVEAMRTRGIAVAPWVEEMLAAGRETFYESGGAAPAPDHDLGDGVYYLDSLDNLDEALAELERGEWRGIVIALGAPASAPAGGDASRVRTAAGTPPDQPPRRQRSEPTQQIRFSSKPIVAAASGRTLGVAAEVCMAAARVVAAAETYIGFVDIPAAGGCKELVRRVVSPPLRQAPQADPLPFLQNVMQTIGSARISTSAAEARVLGFLGPCDRIVMNRDHVIDEAKKEVLALVEQGYTPPPREKNCYAAGRDVLAAIRAGIYGLQQGAYITEEQAKRNRRLAYILCGGELSSGDWVDEQHFLDLERRA